MVLSVQVRRSYYVRLAIVGVLTVGIGILILGYGYLRWPRHFDDDGVTRRDGKRFRWVDLQSVSVQTQRYHGHSTAVLLSVRLSFRDGVVMVYPFPLQNGGAVLSYLRRLPGGECLDAHGYRLPAVPGSQANGDPGRI